MTQINDAIRDVVGGQINDGLLVHYQANGATSNVLVEAEAEFLIFAGAVVSTLDDMWHELLGPGHLDDLLLTFWEAGGTFTPPAVAPVWTTNPPDPVDGQDGIVYPGHNFQNDVDVTATYAVTTGTLPSGLSLSVAGLLTGTPDTPGVESAIQVTATNAAGGTESLAFDIKTIVAAPVWANNPPNPPDGQDAVVYAGHDFSADLADFGLDTFAVTAGTLPSGLSLAASTGLLTGTPDTEETQAGIVVTATNEGGATASSAFDIDIAAAGESLGPELITNGGFTGTTGWTFGTGWTNTGGSVAASNGATAGNLEQDNVTPGSAIVSYRLTFDVVTNTSDQNTGLRAQLAGGTFLDNIAGTVGAKSMIITSSNSPQTNLVFFTSSNNDFAGSIDNVSLKEIL